MTRLIKIVSREDGLTVLYRVGGDERGLVLSDGEINGLTLAQIKALAQTRANQDTGLPGQTGEREDVLANPVKQARQWFIDNPSAIAFLENTPAQIDTAIETMTLAQLRQVVKGVAIIARTLALLEIAD